MAQDDSSSTSSVSQPLADGTIMMIAALAGVISAGVFRFQPFRAYGTTEYLIGGLTLFTAVVHILVGASNDILVLNGLGYLFLLVLIYVIPADPIVKHRKQLRWLLAGYAGLTIILYFIVHPWGYVDGSLDWLGLMVKAVELVLIGVIILGNHFDEEPTS